MAKSESTKIEFGYFHDYESEQFAFYRIPKVLFTDEYFRNLSSDAKVLYGLMLDRMALSIRNNWVDNEGKVYIIFTLEQVMEYMNCGKDKGVKILAELDTDKGIGLIERVKRGLGKPTIIYVKSFVYRKEKVLDSAENDNRSQEVGKAEVKSSEKPKSGVLESRSQEFGKTEVWKSEKSKSRVRKNRSTEVGKTDPNNTNYNYTDISNTDRSNTDLINLSDSSEQQSMDLMEEMGLFQMNTALVKRNIEYDCLVQRCRLGEQQQLDEIVALIVETISIERENITISGVKYPYQFVKSRLLLLEESHIEYVLDCLHENTREVKNIKAYLLTVHEGAAVRQMEKRGIQTNIGNLNREIRAANRLMKSIRQLIQNLKGWITELGEKRKELLAQKAAEEATLLPNLLMKYMEIRKEERKDWTRAGQNRGTSQDLKAVSEALFYLRQKGLSTVEDLEVFLESSGKSAADYRNQMKPKEARSKVIDGILASRTDCKECKPVYEKYQKIFFKKTKEKFKQEHPEVARYEKAAAYLAKHPDDKDSTQKELQEEQETLLEEIAALKTPLTEVQEDLKKLRDIRYWVRKATPGTEESKEPPKKQPIKEVLQDKADEKKAQRTAPAQAKHRQQDMEL